jgi:hypothetical protein
VASTHSSPFRLIPKTGLVTLALGVLLCCGVNKASADFVFQLDFGNGSGGTIGGFTGPYATVDVNLIDSTHATVTFTSLLSSGNINLMGGQGAVAVNVNATSWALGTITGSNAGTGFTPGPYSNGGANTEDGFGTFNQTIDSFDGFGHSADKISFGLTDTSGTWADASTVLAANANNALAAAHIFVTSSPANASNTALITGYASGGTPNGPPPFVGTVPEPASLVLLGLGGLFGLGAMGFKRRRQGS